MTNHIEKAVAAGIEPIIEKLFELENRIESIQLKEGPKGKDADNNLIASVLVNDYLEVVKGPPGKDAEIDLTLLSSELQTNPEFIKRTQPPPVDHDKLVEIIIEKYIDVIRGEPGKAPEIDYSKLTANLKDDSNFISACQGEKGSDAKETDIKDIVKYLLENHLDLIRGKDGETPEIELDIDALQVTLKNNTDFVNACKGAKGERGEKGEPGADGVGIQIKHYEPGIHREGTIVQANIGQYFKAKRDTATNTDNDADWERIGTGGFRHTGVKSTKTTYREGDLFIDNGTTFLIVNDNARMIAQKGRTGEKGEPGKDGKDGKDASKIYAVSMNTKSIIFVFDDGETIEGAFDGLNELAEDCFKSQALAFIEQNKEINFVAGVMQQESLGVPLRVYRGIYKVEKDYFQGDAVNYQRALYLFAADAKKGDHEKNMLRIAGSGSGGVSNSGGASTSDDIANNSSVAGATVTDALNALESATITQYAGEISLNTPSDNYAFVLDSVTVAEISNSLGLSLYVDFYSPTLLTPDSGHTPDPILIKAGDAIGTAQSIGQDITIQAGNGYELAGGNVNISAGINSLTFAGGALNLSGSALNFELDGEDFFAVNETGLSLGEGQFIGDGGQVNTPLYTSEIDDTTGVHFPGTEQVAISCGGNNALAINGPSASADLFTNTFNLGSDLGFNLTRTDSTTKIFYALCPHYLNSEEAVAIFGGTSNAGNNTVAIGGGTLGANAATRIFLYCADNTATTLGTIVAAVYINGFTLMTGTIKHTVDTNLTASTTQAQGQNPLTKDFNNVTTVANANDVVTMPDAVAGMEISIRNSGANILQIFPASGDDLGAGVDASVTLAVGSLIRYITFDTTTWYAI